MPSDDTPSLPYAEIAPVLLEVIYDSLFIIYNARFEGCNEFEMNKALVECALKLEPKRSTRNNPHILEGLEKTDGGLPRITRLCLEAVEHARNPAFDSDGESQRGIFVPSPLAIMVNALTVPSCPESAAYGFALARAVLFSHFKIHPPTSDLPDDWAELPIADFQDAIESFRIYAKHRDNIHHSKNKPARVFIAHFLAMSGFFILRFGTAGRQTMEATDAQRACLEFLRGKQFLRAEPDNNGQFEFRIAPGLVDLPDTQELLNSLMGVPVAIAGGATVFFGGLQRAHDNSLVMSVSGSAGTGKTSFALGLAASLAPFGTKCLYCTFEEDAETLERRAISLVPQYFRRATLPNLEEGWLHPVNLDPTRIKSVKSFVLEYLPVIKEQLAAVMKPADPSKDSLPGVAPVLVVIDSLTTIIESPETSQLEDFCTFVNELKQLHCIVLLLSAEGIPQGSRLEYLVDSVINLRHEHLDVAKEKPVRLFRLVKSRLQMSRPGSHVLHLSGERGFRISPQLPSQLDSHKIHKTPLPEFSEVLDTLRMDGKGASDPRQRELLNAVIPERLINIYPRSKILIHGHGSSGKATIALRILMSHSLVAKTGEKAKSNLSHKRSRILAISFLYPEKFYFDTFRTLSYGMSAESIPDLDVMALTPGFIGPEDFVDRVLLEIERGHLEGKPYTGVLLDGLHNTFLQFPALQENPMVWPALYSLLSHHELTIVTTFTTFSKTHPSRTRHNSDDEELILKGQLPFLHVIVQGTDFYLTVEPRDPKHHDRTFHITVESALGQRIPSVALRWNADNHEFEKFDELDPAPPDPQLRLPFV